MHKMAASGRVVMEEEEDENRYGVEDEDFEDEQLPRCLRHQHHQTFVPHQASLMSELGEALRNTG